MSGYEADIEQLRRSADAATSVGEQASEIGLGESVNSVLTGLPGSESAAVATRLAGAWKERLDTWAADIRGFGESVSAAANGYAASDEAAEEAFGGSLWERLESWF
ncbi:MAG: hypothetical protein ACRDTF_02690 [Pseudonocardiaceae bacterium]